VAYTPVFSPRFKRDYKKLQSSGRDISATDQVISLLVAGFRIPPKHRDHALKAEWSSYRECHILPDLLLIYRIKGNALRLVRLGSHAELFE
jgi:mRNA interferase YafQ